MIRKIDGCKNNREKSSMTKVCKHIPSSFSVFTTLSLKDIENNDDVYWGKECMKKFWETLRKQALKITDFNKKKNWNY